MTNDDVLYAYRLRVLASARELGSVAAACRMYGIHRSTYYRWKAMSDRFGLEILRPRERRRPQMPNAIPALVEHRIIAFALGAPGSGPARIAAELAREKHGGLRSRRTASSASCAATASTRGRCATGCSPATPRRRSRRVSPSRSATSPWTTPASWCRWTASASAASPAPRASSGSTRRSTPPAPSPGPSCT